MLVRYLLAGAIALGLTAPSAAQTAQPQGQPTQAAESRPAEVVMASAERTSVPNAEAPAAASETPAAPARKRAARVTSCRCAGQTPDATR